MSDLIKRSDAIKAVLGITMYEARVPIDTVIYYIKSLPSADRPQGEWWEERQSEDWISIRRWYCSECGEWQTYGMTNYCPNCGADMRDERREP